MLIQSIISTHRGHLYLEVHMEMLDLQGEKSLLIPTADGADMEAVLFQVKTPRKSIDQLHMLLDG